MLWTRNPHEDSRLQQQRCYTDHIVLAKMFESPLIKSHFRTRLLFVECQSMTDNLQQHFILRSNNKLSSK